MKRATIIVVSLLVLLVVAGGLCFHYRSLSVSGIAGGKVSSGNSLAAKSGSGLKVNEGGEDHVRVKVLYASEVRGIRAVAFTYMNTTSYWYIYPFDGYTGYLFKVNVTNEGSRPAHFEFYLVTNDGKRIWSDDHTVFTTGIGEVPKDVLCNIIRIPTTFSDDRIKNLPSNTTSTVFLYYSVELGEKPAYLYVEGGFANGEAFNFTVPLSLTG